MWEQYLARLLNSNPGVRDMDARLTMTAREFIRQIARAYEAGASDNADKLRAASDFAKPQGTPDFLRDLFTNHFGF